MRQAIGLLQTASGVSPNLLDEELLARAVRLSPGALEAVCEVLAVRARPGAPSWSARA
ncbi:MAG: hypothetical protein M3321_02695 [Actinomycetota bacterium]|nr:hypothetical protein [Actinomycetota bacterium]